MYLSIDDAIKNNHIPNIYLIFGEEEFLRDEAQTKLIHSLVKTEYDSYNFDVFEGDSVSLSKLLDVCRSYPMMSEKRIVVIKRFEKFFSGRQSKKSIDNSPFKKYLENPSPQTVLIINAEIDKAKDFVKNVKGNAFNSVGEGKLKALKFPFFELISNHAWDEFPKIYDNEYPRWIKKRFKLLGKDIDDDAANLLAMQVRSSLRDLSNEIDKLCIYIDKKSKITSDDIHNLIGSTKEFNVFELQKAIAEKNLAKSIYILNKMLANERQEMLIIAILTKFFITLYKLIDEKNSGKDENQLAMSIGVMRFQLNEFLGALKKYKPEEIDKCFWIISETDFKLKSGLSNSLYIMQEMLVKIINPI
jgi:DNA polymerase-3 subunit delta